MQTYRPCLTTEASRPIGQDNPGGRTLREDPTMNANASPLQSSADGSVTELAWFLARAAGWSPGDLDGLDGDPEFTAEVQAAMADLIAGGAR